MVMGRIVAPYGLKGWVRIEPYSADPDSLSAYPSWWVGRNGDWRELKVAQSVLQHGASLVARFEGCIERDAALAASEAAVRQTLDALTAAGIGVPLVTGAGTGSFVREAASGLWGELQAGSYLFMDADYAANQADPGAPVFEHALFIKTAVMSLAADHSVCDAGHKSHAIDSGLPTVWWPTGLSYTSGGDEHGLLRVVNEQGELPALDDTVWLVPGHCDPTVNLHDFAIGVRGGLGAGRVERLIDIDARGALA